MEVAKRSLTLTSVFLVLFLSCALGDATTNNAAPAMNGRCSAAPCTCDQYGRLTCDCKDRSEELILTSEGEWGLSRHTSRISVLNCPNVHLANHSLIQMEGLISVDFVNVANLTLVRHSFKLSVKAVTVRITLRNNSVELLPSNVFHGDVEAIIMENTRIAHVSAFAFANLVNTNSITLSNCHIESIEALAFKKFDVNFLHVIGGTLGGDEVPSRVMIDIEVSDKFMLNGVKMGAVRSSAFIIRKPKIVAILNCAIENLESEAFDITSTSRVVEGTPTSSRVIIQNNTFGHVAFGAFLSIRADTDSKLQPNNNGNYILTFENNNMTSFEEGSLVFDKTSFHTELSNVLVNQICDCGHLSTWKDQILNYTNVYSRLITSRDSINVIVPPYSLESSVDDPETFLCLEDQESRTSISFVKYESRNCSLSSSMLLLIVAISTLVFVIIISTFLTIYCCRKRRRDAQKRWISVPTSAPDVVSKTKNGNVLINRDSNASSQSGPVDSRITMVVPDGRLYRETEFHVIVEKAEPLTTEL